MQETKIFNSGIVLFGKELKTHFVDGVITANQALPVTLHWLKKNAYVYNNSNVVVCISEAQCYDAAITGATYKVCDIKKSYDLVVFVGGGVVIQMSSTLAVSTVFSRRAVKDFGIMYCFDRAGVMLSTKTTAETFCY